MGDFCVSTHEPSFPYHIGTHALVPSTQQVDHVLIINEKVETSYQADIIRWKRIPLDEQTAPTGRDVDAWQEMEDQQGDYLLELWKKQKTRS